jgi:hypothetical protein
VPISTSEFEEKVAALTDPEAKASEMEHAVRAEIHVRVDEDPASRATDPREGPTCSPSCSLP